MMQRYKLYLHCIWSASKFQFCWWIQRVVWILRYTKVIFGIINKTENKLPSPALGSDRICKWNQYAFYPFPASVCTGSCITYNTRTHTLYLLSIPGIHPNRTTHASESVDWLESWTVHPNVHSFHHYAKFKMKREDLHAQNRFWTVTATPNHILSIAIKFKRRVKCSHYC